MPNLPVVSILGELWELPDPSLAARWSRCLTTAAGDAQPRQMPFNSSPYVWTSSATVASIEARAGHWLMLHAAGVSNDFGAVAALIGASGAGKSTAARALCRDQLGYVTDETIAIDPLSGVVVPFPKPIAVIPADGGLKLELGPDELGLKRCSEDVSLGGMILLDRSADYPDPQVEVLEPLDGLTAVIEHTSALPYLPQPLAALATAIDRCGGVHRIRYADAATLEQGVRQALAAPPVRSNFLHHPGARTHAPAVPASIEPGLISRAYYADAIEHAGDLHVLIGSRCISLQGVGAVAWLALRRPMPFDQLLGAVIDVVGDHPAAAALVRAAVRDMQALGVVASAPTDK